MIFKGFKENSAKKHINNVLINRKAGKASSRIKTLGIVCNLDEIENFDSVKSLAEMFKVKDKDLRIVGFSEKPTDNNHLWGNTFSTKDFSWIGKVKHPELKQFVETPFDILISYYCDDVAELKMITAASVADFKVGIFQEDDRLNDLIIKTPINDLNTFKKELKKYLLILNKIADE